MQEVKTLMRSENIDGEWRHIRGMGTHIDSKNTYKK